jgi:hypothetical protein
MPPMIGGLNQWILKQQPRSNTERPTGTKHFLCERKRINIRYRSEKAQGAELFGNKEVLVQ